MAGGINNTARGLLGSLGEGAAALTRADELAQRLAAVGDLPFIGKARGEASRLRSQAVAQARHGNELLRDLTSSYYASRVDDNASALADIGIRNPRRPQLADALHDDLHTLSPSASSVLSARVRTQLQAHVDLDDPDATMAALRTLAAAPAPTLRVEESMQLAAIAELLGTDAVRSRAPQLARAWPADRMRVLAGNASTLRGSADPVRRVLPAIARHVVDGAFADDATHLARTRSALDAPLAIEQVDSLHALLGVREEAILGVTADRLDAYGSLEPTIRQHSAIEALRIALAEQPMSPASLDARLEQLVADAASGTLDENGWAQIRAIGSTHGRVGTLGLADWLPEQQQVVDVLRPFSAQLSYAEQPKAALQQVVIRTWNEQLQLRRLDPAARAARVADLVARARSGDDEAVKLLALVAGTNDARTQLRLGQLLNHPKTVTDALNAGTDNPLARQQLAAWQLDVAASGARAEDDLARSLAARAAELDQGELDTLIVLVGWRGAGERTGLATDLADVSAVRDLARRHRMDRDTERYRAVWAAQARGVDADAAAERTRELLQRSSLDEAQSRELVTYAIDLGGAERLGLPLQLPGSGHATKHLPYVIYDEYTNATRFVGAWRAQLAGDTADPARFAHALDQLERSVEQPELASAAIDELLLYGADLPGADTRLFTHPLASTEQPLVSRLQSIRDADRGIAATRSQSLVTALRDRLRAIELSPAQARRELQEISSTGDAGAVADALFDRGLGIHLDLPPIVNTRRSARTAYVRPDSLGESVWRVVVDARIAGTTPAEAVDELVDLARTSTLEPIADRWRMLGLLQLLEGDAAGHGANPARVAVAQGLAKRARSGSGAADAIARLQAVVADLRDPFPDPRFARSRVIDALMTDWTDAHAARAAQSTLIDNGLLARMLPPELAASIVDQLDTASRSGIGVTNARAAAVRALYELEPAPTGRIADFLQSIEAAAVDAADGADQPPLAILDALIETYRSDLPPREVARLVAGARVDARHLADRARALMGDDGLELPDMLRAQLQDALRRYEDTVGGVANVGYIDHPDYQDLGRIQAILGLAARLDGAADAASGAALLSW